MITINETTRAQQLVKEFEYWQNRYLRSEVDSEEERIAGPKAGHLCSVLSHIVTCEDCKYYTAHEYDSGFYCAAGEVDYGDPTICRSGFKLKSRKPTFQMF